MKPSVRNPATEVTFWARHEHFLLKNTTFRDQSYIQTFTKCCACHEKWHLKVTKYCACQEKVTLELPACHESVPCTPPSAARATKSVPWTSPSACTCHEKWHLNLTKCCTCHEKWLLCLILVTYNSFTMRGATGVTIQPHQILRLPQKITLQHFRENFRKRIKRHFQCGADPSMIRAWHHQSATRLATEVIFRDRHEHFLLKNTTFRAQSYIQTFTKCCACHEKWHLNVTKYCACHEKWHLNFPKYCACQEKCPLDFTKCCACHEKCPLDLNSPSAAPATKSLTSHLSYFTLLLLHTSLISHQSYFTLVFVHTNLTSH